MTEMTDLLLERLLTDALRHAAPTGVQEDLVADALRAARRGGRRPRWLALATTRPMARPSAVLVGSVALRRAIALVAVACVLGVGAGLASVGWLPTSPIPAPTPAVTPSVAVPSDAALPTASAAAGRPTFAPDDRLVAYAAPVTVPSAEQQPGVSYCGPNADELCGEHRTTVVNADGTGQRSLFPEAFGSSYPIGWTHHGSQLVVQTPTGIVFATPNGDVQRTIPMADLCPAPCVEMSDATLSPDDARLAMVWIVSGSRSVTELAVFDIASGIATELSSTRSSNEGEQCSTSTTCEGRVAFPQWSPAGDLILFARQRMSPETDALFYSSAAFVVAPDGAGLRRLTPVGVSPYQPRWAPDGGRVVFDNIESVRASDTSYFGRNVGVDTIGADGQGQHHIADGAADSSWAPDGYVIYAARGEFWVALPDGGTATQVGSGFADLTAAGCVDCPRPGFDDEPGAVGLAFWQPPQVR